MALDDQRDAILPTVPAARVSSERRVLLDTTIQIDRRKTAPRQQKLDALLESFEWVFSTGLSLVEFKATLIQECITIHNQMRRSGATFTRARDNLLEKKNQQIGLRAHIFNNIIQVFGSSFDVTEEQDRLLAEKARLQLENIIPRLFDWFVKDSVDVVLNNRLACNRASEPPRKKKAAFETNLPDCKRGKNKSCHVEQVIRDHGQELLKRLEEHLPDSEQLQKASTIFLRVLKDPKADLSHKDCRGAGDCLIVLEGLSNATHTMSTNAREWKPLSTILGFTFEHISYPEEKTK